MAKVVETIRHRVSICGQVRDAVTGGGVPGALVELAQSGVSMRTRADGSYYFEDLPAGRYDLRVSAPEAGGRYGTASVPNVDVADDTAGRAVFDPRANVLLPPTGVAGRVSDAATGGPLAEATARLRGGEAIAKTGADGRYRLSPLQPGGPTLEMLARGYAPETRKLSLLAGQELSVDLDLTKL